MDVQIVGEGTTTVVAVHGIQGTRAAWQPVAHQMSRPVRFVLPNLRGRGMAARGEDAADYGLDAYATDLAEVVAEHVDRPGFFLAGWSMGVSVALAYMSLRLGVRPAGLVLVSGSPCLAQTRWFTGEGRELLANVAARERRLGLREAADHDAVARTWSAISRTSQLSALAAIDVPVLILHGSDDEDCPWLHAAWLEKGLPSAHLVTVDGAGHSLLNEATATVADHIAHFIDRIERAKEHA